MDCRVKPGNDGGEAKENGRHEPGHSHLEFFARSHRGGDPLREFLLGRGADLARGDLAVLE